MSAATFVPQLRQTLLAVPASSPGGRSTSPKRFPHEGDVRGRRNGRTGDRGQIVRMRPTSGLSVQQAGSRKWKSQGAISVLRLSIDNPPDRNRVADCTFEMAPFDGLRGYRHYRTARRTPLGCSVGGSRSLHTIAGAKSHPLWWTETRKSRQSENCVIFREA